MSGFDRRLHACMRICKHSGSLQPASESDDRKVASETMCLLACVKNRHRSSGEKEIDEQYKNGKSIHTSLLPRPNPLITLPSSLIGNGVSGPLSGPAVGSRGPSGRIAVSVPRVFLGSW
jgi:hypothetical protein